MRILDQEHARLPEVRVEEMLFTVQLEAGLYLEHESAEGAITRKQSVCEQPRE